MRTLTFILWLWVALAQGATINVEWDPNPEQNLRGYKAFAGTASRNYGYVADVGNRTTFQYTNLLVSGRYYFAITAYDDRALESEFSDELIAHTPVPYPTNFRAQAIGPKSVTLTWNLPATNIFYYQIVYGSNAGIYPGLIQFTNTPPPFTISNLVSGTTHFFRIAAFNVYNQASSLSPELSANTLLGKPTGLKFLTNSIQGSINLNGPWTVLVARTVYEVPSNYSSLNLRSFLEISQEREQP